MTRSRARRAFVASSAHGHKFMEFYCLTPLGIRVGFPSPKVMSLVPKAQRARTRGTVVIALTANHHYALRGVRPHTPLKRVAAKLKVGTPFHVGKNFWYLTPGTRTRGVLKVVHGHIQEIGTAPARLLRTRAAGRRFFRSFY
jgi:hypothetical protein